MTIASELTTLNTTKNNIKDAIEAKGVTVGAVPFADYPSKIASISGGGSTPLTPIVWTQSYYDAVYAEAESQAQAKAWVRPADWLTLPTLQATDQKFVGLYPVYNLDSNWVAIKAQGAYTVDWGDGVIENYANASLATHNYSWSTISDTTLSTRGYRQAIVTITPQAGQTLTSITLAVNPTSLNSSWRPKWLDIAIAMNNSATISGGCLSLKFLERFRIIGNYIGNNLSSFFESCDEIQSVEMTLVGATSFSSMFNGCRNLVVAPQLNASSVTIMNSMFSGCYSLESVPLYNTQSVETANSMFSFCTSLKTIPKFNFQGLRYASSMFAKCYSLETISEITTGSLLLSTDYMFDTCSSLVALPVFNTQNVTTFARMFYDCRSLQYIPLFNTSNVTTFSNAFYRTSDLQTTAQLDYSKCQDFTNAFLVSGVIELPQINAAAATNFTSAFSGCRNLKNIDIIGTTLVTNATSMFSNSYVLNSVSLVFGNVLSTTNNMFQNCSNLMTVNLQVGTGLTNTSSMFSGCASLVTAPLFNTQNVNNMQSMFAGCASLETVPLFNTQSVTNMSYMFSDCVSLKTVPLFNTSAATTMAGLFSNCNRLESVPLFDTQNVTTMLQMFQNCWNLQTIPNFNTVKVTSFQNFCYRCYSLISVPTIGSSIVTTIQDAFQDCNALKSITITSAATFLNNCFLRCYALEEANIILTSTSTTHTVTSMFQDCANLKKVNITFTNGGRITFNGTSMFTSCNSLVEVSGLRANTTTTADTNTFNSCWSLSKVTIQDIVTSFTVAQCAMGPTELATLFTSLGTASAKTITISGNWGASLLTAGQRAIATSKGWSIVG